MTTRLGPFTCVRLGLAAAWRHRRLVLLVWALFFFAALLAAAPAWRWWNATLSLAPEGDRLLDGLNVALLRELSHFDRSPSYAIAFAPLSAFILAMLVLNPFVASGLLSVLAARTEPGARFFAGATRWYGLFLRLLLLVVIVGVLLAMLFMAVLMPILHIADTNHLERLYLLTAAMIPAALALAFWLASLLLDVARIRAAQRGEPRAWRALRGGIGFLWRHTGATLAVGLTFALLTGLAFAVYVSVASAFTPKSWPAILIAMIWQQALSFTRTGLRVAMLGAGVELVASREPTAPPQAEPIPGSVTSNLAPPDEPLLASIDPS
jgi:hypothetical protein